MWRWFSRKPEKREPVALTACRVSWKYDHDPEVLARDTEACTREFAAWLLTVSDGGDITRRQLVSFYSEFCEVHELRPMAWHRFDLSLKGAGFQRHRLSTAPRVWVYRISRPGAAIVYKSPPPSVARAPRARRAA